MRGAILGMGASCFVSNVDGKTVYKGYEIWMDGKRRSYYPHSCEEALSREDFIYKRLGEHDQILRCYGLEEIHSGIYSLRLELAPLGNVREFIQKHAEKPLPELIRLQMSLDVAVGLGYVHSRQIRHCDLSCRNLFLFEDYRVKLGDFGGSTVKGYGFADTVCEESQYELPCRGRNFNDRPAMKRELFALGSAIYEIMAWSRPFQGLNDKEVEARYAREEFPLLDGTIVAQTVWNCWNEVYDNAYDVVKALRERLPRTEAEAEMIPDPDITRSYTPDPATPSLTTKP